jgi:DNA-binding IclR family transcriptional regulator
MQDQPTQRAILALLLDAHPKSLTISALARQLGGREAVERAVDALASVGLLTRDGDAINPTAAAVHFERLELP